MPKKEDELKGLKQSMQDIDKMAKEMGIKMANIHATKIIIETAEGQKIVLDPQQCTASVMEGFENYGISFQIQARIIEGEIKF